MAGKNFDEQDFNRRAREYLGGHARNVMNSLTGKPVEKVRPWFGEGGLRTEASVTQPSPAPTAAANAQPSATVTQAGGEQRPGLGVNQGIDNPARSFLLRDRVQSPVAPPNTSRVDPVHQLASGIGYQPMADGSRVYTMGTPGQDGYGKMTVRPPTGNAGNQTARQLLTGGTTSARTPSGMEVSGPADAVERFMRPVAPPAQQRLTGNMIQARTADYSFLDGPKDDGRPKYKGGKGSGIGWKTAAKLYQTDMDAWNARQGRQDALDLEAMREAGAGRRSLLQAQGVNDANAIAMQRLIGENAMNEARIATEGVNQQKGQLDINQAQNLTRLQQQYLGEKDPAKQRLLGQQLLTMHGKDPKEWQITTREETDPANPMIPKKVSYAVNLQDPTRVVEIGGQGNRGPLPLPNEASQRKPGQVYMAPSGHLLQWDGKGLKPAQ